MTSLLPFDPPPLAASRRRAREWDPATNASSPVREFESAGNHRERRHQALNLQALSDQSRRGGGVMCTEQIDESVRKEAGEESFAIRFTWREDGSLVSLAPFVRQIIPILWLGIYAVLDIMKHAVFHLHTGFGDQLAFAFAKKCLYRIPGVQRVANALDRSVLRVLNDTGLDRLRRRWVEHGGVERSERRAHQRKTVWANAKTRSAGTRGRFVRGSAVMAGLYGTICLVTALPFVPITLSFFSIATPVVAAGYGVGAMFMPYLADRHAYRQRHGERLPVSRALKRASSKLSPFLQRSAMFYRNPSRRGLRALSDVANALESMRMTRLSRGAAKMLRARYRFESSTSRRLRRAAGQFADWGAVAEPKPDAISLPTRPQPLIFNKTMGRGRDYRELNVATVDKLADWLTEGVAVNTLDWANLRLALRVSTLLDRNGMPYATRKCGEFEGPQAIANALADIDQMLVERTGAPRPERLQQRAALFSPMIRDFTRSILTVRAEQAARPVVVPPRPPSVWRRLRNEGRVTSTPGADARPQPVSEPQSRPVRQPVGDHAYAARAQRHSDAERSRHLRGQSGPPVPTIEPPAVKVGSHS